MAKKRSKKFSKKAHSFDIHVGSAAKAKRLKHEMNESPAHERIEERLYAEYMKRKKAR